MSNNLNQWHSKELGDGVQAFGPSDQIKQAFLPLFVAAGQPTDMAVLSRYDLERNIVTVYFSPRAAALAKMYDAIECDKPKNEKGLGILVGDQRCFQVLYQAEK